jgi:hypothetical protein
MALWVEPAGASNGDRRDSGFTEVKFREMAYSEIRRFIVLTYHVHHSLCMLVISELRQPWMINADYSLVLYTLMETVELLRQLCEDTTMLKYSVDSLEIHRPLF